MAKFCKSGGEACMVAIRIARAFTKKKNIAFCGYHGWHDWYLATNLNNSKNLDLIQLMQIKLLMLGYGDIPDTPIILVTLFNG